MTKPRNVAILLFDEIEVLDFAGPFEVFSVAARKVEPPPFNVYTISQHAGPVTARGGLSINPTYTLADCPAPDILVVPGGQGTRTEIMNTALIDWLRTQAARVELLLSVCTGALLLGRAGLLTGLGVTTHHGAYDELRAEVPSATLYPNRRYVDNGQIVCSAGVSAGIDMAVYIVERLLGRTAAQATVRNMAYTWQPEPFPLHGAAEAPAVEAAAPIARPAIQAEPPQAAALTMTLDPAPWQAADRYQSLWEAVDQTTARWLWTDGRRFDLRPTFFRRQGMSRGRRLTNEPEDRTGCYLYALDAAQRVIFSRYYYESGELTETFYLYSPDAIEEVAYAVGQTLPRLSQVIRHERANGVPQVYSAYTTLNAAQPDAPVDLLYCTYREIYSQHAGRLAHVRTIQFDSQRGYISSTYNDFLVYDAVGRLDYIHREYSADEAYVVYQRPRRGQTLQVLLSLVRDRLSALIPDVTVGLIDEADPLYCLALLYDPGDEDGLPPRLAPGTADARMMLIDEHGAEVADYLWDPEEFMRYGLGDFGYVGLDERDDVLDEACFMLNQQIKFLDRWDLPRKLLNDVAKTLNAGAFAGRRGLAPDFVVYAVDTPFEEFDENFQYSVPADRVATLAAENLY